MHRIYQQKKNPPVGGVWCGKQRLASRPENSIQEVDNIV
jgi:hypothetical protein